MGWVVYILRCADSTLYTGIARNLKKRLAEHSSGAARAARYTRGRRPLKLVWQQRTKNRSQALKRESEIKGLRRAEKLALIAPARQRQEGQCRKA